MVLEAALTHVWLKEGGRVVGHPPTPGEKLKGREEAETFGNSKERSRCIPGRKGKLLLSKDLQLVNTTFEGRKSINVIGTLNPPPHHP